MLSVKSGIEKIRREFQASAASLAVAKLLETVQKHPMGKNQHDTGTGGDNARYGAVVAEGTSLAVKYNCHPCHAFMKNYPKPVAVYNQYGHRVFIDKKADRAWFDFITSDDGPWKEFKSRKLSHAPDTQDLDNLDFIWNNGWVWTDLKNHPSNLQHNFLVATRMGTEWPKFIERWYSYVQKDCHPGMAFAFLDIFREVSGDTKKWQINNANKYDWPIDVCTSTEDYIRNFCLGKVEKLNKSYAESQQYTPVNRIFGDNGLSSSLDTAYPNRVFELYHGKYGPTKEECDAYWSKKGTGFSKFNYRTHWFISEPEIIKIIKEESKRLLNV